VIRCRPVALAVALVLLGAGCAKRVAPPIPEGEVYVFPVPAAGELSAEEAAAARKAWTALMAGDAEGAARRYERLVERRPGSAAAKTGLGYAHLRAGRLEAAARLFTAALERDPRYVPALVGQASVANRRGDPEAALASYRLAQEAAPQDALVRKRLAALKLQVADQRMAEAEASVRSGDTASAAEAYGKALDAAPELAAVRLALADVLVGRKDTGGAIEVLRADPTQDRAVALKLGGLLASRQDFEEAAEVFDRLLARDPADEEARAGAKAARESLALLAMPEEYRQIDDAPRITRGDLAALLVVRVRALRRLPAGEPQVVVDVAGSWAREYIQTAVSLGILSPYPNHTFQPGATVRRGDLARALTRVLDRVRWPQAPAPVPTDMSPAHLDYPAAQRVLAAGLMGLTPSGAFEPWRPVSGREAEEAVEGLGRLLGS
jgi:tetratricopeptide (TPR) repeat protein